MCQPNSGEKVARAMCVVNSGEKIKLHKNTFKSKCQLKCQLKESDVGETAGPSTADWPEHTSLARTSAQMSADSLDALSLLRETNTEDMLPRSYHCWPRMTRPSDTQLTTDASCAKELQEAMRK